MQTPEYKLFSKAWFENYWYYYKWMTIAGIAVLLAIILFAKEMVFKTEPDFSLNYMGNPDYNFVQMSAYDLEAKLVQHIEDVNRDKKSLAKVNLVYLDRNDKSKEAAFMFQLADVEMAAGQAAVYIFDREYVGRYAKYGLNDLSELAKKYGISQEQLLMDEENGYPYAVSLKGNKLLERSDIITDELFLVVRPLRSNESKEQDRKRYEHSLKMADFILSQN